MRIRLVALCVLGLTTLSGASVSAHSPSSPVPRTVQQAAATAVGMLAYVAWGQDNEPNIYTIRTDGSRSRQLTTGGGLGPAWSPDGSQLAFWWNNRIGVMSADGTTRSWVATGSSPTWSPDGRKLAYSCDEDGALCAYDLDTRHVTVIVPRTTDGAYVGVGQKDWSPDGSSIVFTGRSSEGDDYTNYRQLFLVRPDGTGLRAVPNTFSTATDPAWSRDGSALLYAERYDGRGGEVSGDIYSIRPDGTARTPVVKQPGTDDDPAWSPDGRTIAFTSAALGYPRMHGIWTTSPDGRNRHLVVRGGEDPSWRPEFEVPATLPPTAPETSGRRIAYVAASDTGFDLFVVRPDGDRSRRLTTHGRAQNPEWSPDHTRIAYSTSHGGIRVLMVNTGIERKVAKSYGVAGLTWSPSGRLLAWGGFEGLTILNLRTGDRRVVPIEVGCCPRDPAWSPDGRVLAFSQDFSTQQTDIMTVSPSGKGLRRVTRLRGTEREAEWSPDGRTIAFTHEQGSWWMQSADVLTVRGNGRDLRTLSATDGLSYSPSWSQDGRLAWYSDGRSRFPAPRAGLWIVDARGRRELIVPNRTIAYVAW
jgi:Tol biopolymer transport system component